MEARRWLQCRPLLYLWLPVAVWMGLIFFLSAQPDLPHPDIGWADLLISSIAHTFMFAVLALLWARTLGERPRGWLLVLGLTMLYAISDELHQVFVPGRHADPWDLLCDLFGAVLGLGLWALLRYRVAGSRRSGSRK